MSNRSEKQIYEFEEFWLDAAHLMLYRNGGEISLPPKAIKTLLALIERTGEIVSKDELIEIIWTDSIVEESNLSQYLHLLRKTLGNRTDGKPFIETLRGRGYRFSAEVSCVIENSITQNSLSNKNQSANPEISKNRRLTFERNENVLAIAERHSEPQKDFTEKISTKAVLSLISPVPFSEPLIGREREIAEITTMLKRDDVRLLTLTGVGGVGKTAIAQTIARRMRDDFADGVLFVELAAVTNPELVISTIASSLAVKEATGKSVNQVLKDYLQERQMLLVVDNFEQVIAAAPQIAELLIADKLKVLITSRVFLRLSMEREFVVSPLAVPSDKLFGYYSLSNADDSKESYTQTHTGKSDLLEYAAVKLFVERAQNVKSNFALSSENAKQVAEICTRLNGIPLAIELAAVRVKLMSPRAILSRLESQLKLLTGGARDLPARQQTMYGAIEWSYNLLDDEQKVLFRRLAVFAGGFTIEAAETVCGEVLSSNFNLLSLENDRLKRKYKASAPAGEIQNIDVLDGLTALAENSLLVQIEQLNGESRFRMLEVVREYALETLETSGEWEAMRRRHTEYCLRLAEEAEPFLQAAQSAKWLNRLEEEHDNIRVALRWALLYDAELGQQLVAAIWRFWLLHGHIREGCELLDAFLSQMNSADKKTRTKMLLGASFLNRIRGNFELTRSCAEESLALAQQTDDKKSVAFSLYQLGLLALDRDVIQAGRLFEEGLTYARDSEDKQILGLLLNGLGEFSRSQKDYKQAENFYRQALAINRESGDSARQVTNLVNLGATALAQKNSEAAGSFYQDGLRISSEMADVRGALYCLEGVAGAYWAAREPKRAALLLGAAEASREVNNLPIEPADRLPYEQSHTLVCSSLTKEAFTNCFAKGHRLKLEEAVELALEKKAITGKTQTEQLTTQ